MGYSYQKTSSGREALCCDNCPAAGREAGVRKRTCPHRVHYRDGGSLPYCPAPALCSNCYRSLGCQAGVHANCAEACAAQQAREDAVTAKIAAGDLPVRAAWGGYVLDANGQPMAVRELATRDSWTLVLFGDLPAAPGGREEWRLVPKDEYRSNEYLSDHDARGAKTTDLRR